jgi:hypothetical protein
MMFFRNSLVEWMNGARILNQYDTMQYDITSER